jgi:hypothetical protein
VASSTARFTENKTGRWLFDAEIASGASLGGSRSSERHGAGRIDTRDPRADPGRRSRSASARSAIAAVWRVLNLGVPIAVLDGGQIHDAGQTARRNHRDDRFLMPVRSCKGSARPRCLAGSSAVSDDDPGGCRPRARLAISPDDAELSTRLSEVLGRSTMVVLMADRLAVQG